MTDKSVRHTFQAFCGECSWEGVHCSGKNARKYALQAYKWHEKHTSHNQAFLRTVRISRVILDARNKKDKPANA